MASSLASSPTAGSSQSRRFILLLACIGLLSLAIVLWAIGGGPCAVDENSKDLNPTRIVSTLHTPERPGETKDILLRESTPERRAGLFPSRCDLLKSRAFVGDVSPPGMWPAPEDTDADEGQDEFRRRSVLTGTAAPKTRNVGQTEVELPQSVSQADSSAQERSHLLRGQRPVKAADKVEKVVGNVLNFAASYADNSAVDQETWTHSVNEGALQHTSTSQRRTLLQADISPPGMWPDSDDDESASAFSFEFSQLGLSRRLLHDLKLEVASPSKTDKLFDSFMLRGKRRTIVSAPEIQLERVRSKFSETSS